MSAPDFWNDKRESEKVINELNNHYEVLTEAIQTVLRKNKVNSAYELLKELSRGKELTKEDIKNFINKLDIPEEDKKRFLDNCCVIVEAPCILELPILFKKAFIILK